MNKKAIILGIVSMFAIAMLVSTVGMGVLGQSTTPTQPEATEAPESAADNGPDADLNEQSPSYSSSIAANDANYEGMSEADESAALAGMATITPEQASTAALNAYPGTTILKTELDNENGAVVYSVELSNGLDVKVDAGNASILYVDN